MMQRARVACVGATHRRGYTEAATLVKHPPHGPTTCMRSKVN
jgi:hypothetical protein